ncbi:uncharacterized protein PHACADRAFT_209375 [Phanerochaete carnosa HHB-10118-sp]|uniref:Cytochrome P450 n=1 Tax=Phanerochaete carnosa (strain HHB-10118-sp) TaxID=650164 RepID=K5WA79_PHACS|nr:uncharacterized protein PHACADRAFT_209375 [Phanerochaete carnosa HHB-10118-sp]EKM55864.1 hypothetical protein PHACADRAFT_209375 [Phanerochaete carnosa HHB-10118-sp]
MAGAIILDVVNTFDVRPGDPRIELIEEAMHTSMEIITAGVYLVDLVPILKHLPSWFPRAGFKHQAAKWKTLVDGMYEIPYSQLNTSMREGNAEPCLAATLLSRIEDTEDATDFDNVFMSVTGTIYGAGADTTVAALTTFVLVMTMFSVTQLAVHEGLDRVLSRKRLPEMEDRGSLPRITANLYELLRAILRDTNTYPDPDTLKPERFLNEDRSLRNDVPYPTEAFGFGRRICPGRHFAHDIMWLDITNILAVIKIEHAINVKNGDELALKGEFTPRFISMPKPFKFTPRFPKAETLIQVSAFAD